MTEEMSTMDHLRMYEISSHSSTNGEKVASSNDISAELFRRDKEGVVGELDPVEEVVG